MSQGRFFTQDEMEKHLDKAMLTAKSSILRPLLDEVSHRAVDLFREGNDAAAVEVRSIAIRLSSVLKTIDDRLLELTVETAPKLDAEVIAKELDPELQIG